MIINQGHTKKYIFPQSGFYSILFAVFLLTVQQSNIELCFYNYCEEIEMCESLAHFDCIQMLMACLLLIALYSHSGEGHAIVFSHQISQLIAHEFLSVKGSKVKIHQFWQKGASLIT